VDSAVVQRWRRLSPPGRQGSEGLRTVHWTLNVWCSAGLVREQTPDASATTAKHYARHWGAIDSEASLSAPLLTGVFAPRLRRPALSALARSPGEMAPT
jgi:hypothetical protein